MDSTPVPCKQHKGPEVTGSHMQDPIKSDFPAAVLISSWCRCGCICLLNSTCSSDPSPGGELCLSGPLPGMSLAAEGRQGLACSSVPPIANHDQCTQPAPYSPLQSLQGQCIRSSGQTCPSLRKNRTNLYSFTYRSKPQIISVYMQSNLSRRP